MGVNYQQLLPCVAVVPPTVSGVSPNSGPVAGGTPVIITGTGFTPSSTVAFGATPAASSSYISPTSFNATSPAHIAATVDVTVTNSAGTSPTNPSDQFTFMSSSIGVTNNSGIGGMTSSTASINWSNPTVSGSNLVIGLILSSSVTITPLPGWTLISADSVGLSWILHIYVYYAAPSQTSVSFSLSTSTSWAMGGLEITNPAASDLDQNTHTNGNGTSVLAGPTGTLSHSVEASVVVSGIDTTTLTPTWSNGYSLGTGNPAIGAEVILAYLITSSTSPTSTSCFIGSPCDYSARILTFF
jgi:hypothetical protein